MLHPFGSSVPSWCPEKLQILHLLAFQVRLLPSLPQPGSTDMRKPAALCASLEPLEGTQHHLAHARHHEGLGSEGLG